MTVTREPQQEGSIQGMLRDSGLDASTELRSSLEELHALVPDSAPALRADLAALLAAGARRTAGGATAATTTVLPAVASAPDHSGGALPAGVVSLAERRGRTRRLAIVGGAVVGAMTLGAGAVAASSEDFRLRVSDTVGVIFQPSGETPDVAPAPGQPSPAEIPAVPVPSIAANGTTPPAAENMPQAPGSVAGSVPGEPAAPPVAVTPPAAGRGGVLPTPAHGPFAPGLPGLPGPGEGRGLSLVPLPAPALPGVLPTLPGQP